MSRTKEAVDRLVESWKELKKAHPHEEDLSSHGVPFTVDTVDQVINQWQTAIDALEEKGTWVNAPEAALSDAVLASEINELTGIFTSAKGQSIGWAVSQGLANKAVNVNRHLGTLITRRVALTRAVARELTSSGAAQIEQILAAERAAKEVLRSAQRVLKASTLIDEKREATEASEAQLNQKASEISKHAESAQESAKIISESEAKISAALKAANDLKEEAEQREAKLAQRISEVQERVRKTDEEAKDALASVKAALRAARDQGLAGAFQNRSKTLRGERIIWGIVFMMSIGALALLAQDFASDITALTYEQLIVSLLRRSALAAPGVWLGWYAARQLGRITKVQEDYEYKAASALAFQSYKDEVAYGADGEMLKKLLEHAITTFGSNPVRLYDHNRDPVTPTEDALQKLPSRK
jgi:hypothetical protein